MTPLIPAEEESEIQVAVCCVSSLTEQNRQASVGPHANASRERPVMKIPTNTHKAVMSSTSTYAQAPTQEMGSVPRAHADYLYQAATIAAAILVLMSI
jgi:hypothetical protein